jgi:hypothetical protein
VITVPVSSTGSPARQVRAASTSNGICTRGASTGRRGRSQLDLPDAVEWQSRLIATGKAAMCVGIASMWTATVVTVPPKPAGPMPVALMASTSCRSSAASAGSGLGSPEVRHSAHFAR